MSEPTPEIDPGTDGHPGSPPSEPGSRKVADELRERVERTEFVELEGHHRGERMTLGQKIWYRVLWSVCRLIGYGYFRAKVIGRENVPRSGAFIVSPIHRSNLDTPLISLITSRRLRYMGKESLWKNRFWAWFFSGAGGFPVARATADREALRACMEVVERGEPLVMFPEGTRQSGPTVSEMFDGPAYVACRAQVPILPVGIGGTEQAMPKGRKVPPPVKLVLVIGKPIYPQANSATGRVPRRAVRELTQQLGEEIQVLFDAAQVEAGHPNVYDRTD